VPSLRIEGYVIVSADGMLADARNVMPDELKFEGDKAFFTAALDRADLILHGRNSYEDQPNSPRAGDHPDAGKSRQLAPDPANPKATLWNPAGASFEDRLQSCRRRCRHRRRDRRPRVFGMFMDRYDEFWLSVAPHVPPARRRALLPRCARAVRHRRYSPRTGCARANRRCSTPLMKSASRRGGAAPSYR
jgi:hypothetical protein